MDHTGLLLLGINLLSFQEDAVLNLLAKTILLFQQVSILPITQRGKIDSGIQPRLHWNHFLNVQGSEDFERLRIRDRLKNIISPQFAFFHLLINKIMGRTDILPFCVLPLAGSQWNKVGVVINQDHNTQKGFLIIILIVAKLHFGFNAVQITKILHIYIVKANVFKRNIRISILLQKTGGSKSPCIVNAPHLGYRWRNTCYNASHLGYGWRNTRCEPVGSLILYAVQKKKINTFLQLYDS